MSIAQNYRGNVSHARKDAATDVRVRVTRSVVVHVKQTMIQVLTIVTTTVQTRVRRIKVPIIQRKTPTAAQETPKY